MATDKATGTRYRDLRAKIADLEQRLAESICPHCNKVRKESHLYVNNEEVACPAIAYGPFPPTGDNRWTA